MLPTVKIGGSLVRNAGFSASTCLVSSHWFSCGVAVSMGEAGKLFFSRRFRRKTTILRLQRVKIGRSLARNARFGAPTCLVSSLWFSGGFAVSMGEAAKHVLFEGFPTGCHVVLRGRRSTLWHSNLLDNVTKVSNLAEVSHEILVLLLPRVSSRVSGFPVASPCLWGKLHTLHFTLHTPQFTL